MCRIRWSTVNNSTKQILPAFSEAVLQSCNFSHDLHKNHTLDYYKLKGSQGENEKYELTKTMNEIFSNPVNVCRDICSEGRENSARGVTRNQGKQTHCACRWLPLNIFVSANPTWRPKMAPWQQNFNPPLLKNHCRSEPQIWEFILLTFNLLYDKKWRQVVFLRFSLS